MKLSTYKLRKLREFASKHGRTANLCSWAIVKKRGLITFTDQPCYVGLSRYSTDNTEAEYIYCAFNHRRAGQCGIPKKTQTFYLEWLLNSSPWSRCYETKCAKEASKYGVVVNTGFSTQEMQWAMVAYRNVFEHPMFCVAFKHLMSNGCEPTLSYLVAHSCAPTKSPLRITGHVKEGDLYYSHCPINPVVTKGMYQNMLNKNVHFTSPYKESKRYVGVAKLYGIPKGTEKGLARHLEPVAAKFRKVEGAWSSYREWEVDKMVEFTKDLEEEWS